MLDKGIYIEFKPAPYDEIGSHKVHDFLHSYIVYRDGNGGARVIRGGPSVGDSKLDHARFGPLGKIEVQVDVPLDKSKDAYKPGETPRTRQATKLDIGNRDPEKVFNGFVSKSKEFDGLNIDYDIKGPSKSHQTSNSLPRFLLEDAGIDPKTAIPEKIDRARIPGFENDLKEALEEARRERDRPNPIEGEIGGTDDQNPTPSDPDFSDNGPSGHDDGADDDDASGGGNKGGGDAQKQSLDLTTDPDIGKKTLELKLGPDGEPIYKGLTPEQNMLLKDFGKNDGPLGDILAKDPRDLTNEEFMTLKKEIVRLPAGAEQEQLDGVAMEFLKDKFGTGPAKTDAVGRMIDPEPIRPINKNPVPAKTPDGESLQGAMQRIGKVVAGAAGGDENASAVQGLQTGLNILKQVMFKNSPAAGTDLKTDGVVGPKTRQALKVATSRLGRPKIEEGLALGRFGRFAQDLQTGRNDTRKLGATMGKSFGPLFRNPQPSRQHPSRPAVENVPFQSTINDLGFKAFGQDTFKPIREDGLIGPKTESAFQAVLPAAGADTFTSRLGHNMGFFDFDDIA